MSATLEASTPTSAGSAGQRTVVTRVKDWATQSPDAVAMREKRYGLWQDITWATYWDMVQTTAHALMSLGIGPGDRVAIHSENRPEWLYADLGTVACRAITMGLYPTNPAAEVEYLLKDSGSRVLVAEDQEQVDKALAVGDSLDELEWIVYIEPRGVRDYDDRRLISWDDFLERGREHRAAHEGVLEQLAAEVSPDDVMTLIYTSGTTGPPKGAMLTVGNVEFAISKLVSGGGFYDPPPNPDDVARVLPAALPRGRAHRHDLGRAPSPAPRSTSPSPSRRCRPTSRRSSPRCSSRVPRIWEKIHAGIQIRMYSASRLKKWNYALWMKVAERIGDELVARDGQHTWWTKALYWLGYPFLFRALRDRIGLRKCRAAGSGAAPIAPEVLKFFFGLNIIIYEIYGMTENTAVATSNRPGRVKLGTVGLPHPGIEVKLDEQTNEILTRHPANFAGYWNKPDKTAETIDADGWLHTGDVGEWVDGTHLKIVDRIKDIIITAGGKNISPSEIENSLKTSPFVKEAVVIGDKRKYLTALIGIELDTVGDWATRNQIPYTTYRDLSEKREVLELIQGVVRETNDKFARVENVRKFRMIPKELDHEDGELTATQKVKRSSLMDMFGELVDDMYGGPDRPRRRRHGQGAHPRPRDGGHRRRGLRSVRGEAARDDRQRPGAGQHLRPARPRLRHHLQGDAGRELRPAVADDPRRVPDRLLRGAPTSCRSRWRCSRPWWSRRSSAPVVERIAMRPMVGEPVFSAAMVTVGVFIALRVIANDFIGLPIPQVGDPWGLQTRRGRAAPSSPRSTSPRSSSPRSSSAALLAFFKYTRFGLAMRATAFDQETALAQGVRVGRMFGLAWALSGALSAIAGTFVATGGTGVDPNVAFIALKALPAIILGGLDSIGGAVVGGLIDRPRRGLHQDLPARRRPVARAPTSTRSCPTS